MIRKNEAVLLEQFQDFRKENPLDFDCVQMKKIESDIRMPRDGVVCDEYVEFILWTRGLKSRQEYFAEYVTTLFPVEQYKNLLEVGAGSTARLSGLLSEKGYQMTAMDPQLAPGRVKSEQVRCRSDFFIFGRSEIDAYDAVIAQEPCEATEHIIRACTAVHKDFVISLCGAPHQMINGEMPEDVYEWYFRLKKIAGKECTLAVPELIPGYESWVMIGRFG